MSVILETSKGDLVIDLYTDKAPLACKNFLKLCKIKYYNNCMFFNVQKDFMVQTGDPTNTGKGGTSIYGILYGEQAKYFQDEIRKDLKHKKMGLVSMANTGSPNTNGSQFFITTTNNHLDYLDEKHTIFGEVAEGLDVLAKINEAYTDEKGRPYQLIRIKHTVILDDPFEDPPGLEIPDQSPPPPNDIFAKTLIGEDESIDEFEGMTPEQIEEQIRAKQAKSKAIELQLMGDLPDADIKPPENVLFVCKLNPVTQDEDLEIIFSRFGKIKNCEIIRDRKTKESLGYAFIEFEDKSSCEAAYFKMENVLIDDRRIHVDFSQSVAKLWNKYNRGEVVVDRDQWDPLSRKKKSGGGAQQQQQQQSDITAKFNLKGAARSSSGGGGGGAGSDGGFVFDSDDISASTAAAAAAAASTQKKRSYPTEEQGDDSGKKKYRSSGDDDRRERRSSPDRRRRDDHDDADRDRKRRDDRRDRDRDRDRDSRRESRGDSDSRRRGGSDSDRRVDYSRSRRSRSRSPAARDRRK